MAQTQTTDIKLNEVLQQVAREKDIDLERWISALEDAMAGAQRQRPLEQCGDLLLRDREGNWTYQLCVVADDAAEGITLVIRGRDLLDSTGRQLLLARLLGSPGPAFLHHPLIGDAEGRKLSKTDGDDCVSAWREAGRSPAELLGHAAWLGGLQPDE